MNLILQRLESFFTFENPFLKKEIYYIGGNDVLPPPLSKNEEEDVLLRLPDDSEARAVLIEHNLK